MAELLSKQHSMQSDNEWHTTEKRRNDTDTSQEEHAHSVRYVQYVSTIGVHIYIYIIELFQ